MTRLLWLLIPLALLLVAACRPVVASAPPEAATREMVPAQATPPTPPPPPKFTPSPDSLTLPPEYLNRDRSQGDTLHNRLWGPQNKGAMIPLNGGKRIKLPDTVYLDVTVMDVICGKAPCPKTPYSVFTTGKGRSVLGMTFDGEIQFEKVALGEEGIFDPIKRQLQ